MPDPRIDRCKIVELDDLLHAILLLLKVLWVSQHLKEHLRRIVVVEALITFPELLSAPLNFFSPCLEAFELPLLNKVVIGHFLEVPSPLLSNILFLHV